MVTKWLPELQPLCPHSRKEERDKTKIILFNNISLFERAFLEALPTLCFYFIGYPIWKEKWKMWLFLFLLFAGFILFQQNQGFVNKNK
jgi:hypothetical protein